MSLNVHDGPYSQPGGLAVGAPSFEFPFLQNGDSASFILTRTYKQTRAAYIADRLSGTFKLGAVHDTQYTNAWLIAETPYSVTTTGLLQFQRRFATIPSTQTVPSSINAIKPELTGEFPQQLGDFTVIQPNESVASYHAYLRKTVTSDSGVVTGSYPTGGTYTLSFDGDTTSAIDYNDVAADVQTALNAETAISDRGNVTVSGSYNSVGGLVVTFGNYATVTIDGSSLTSFFGNTPTNNTTTANGGYTQSVNYGFSSSDTWTGGTFTLTMFGQTTGAIAYNATAATVQTALNALTEVQERGNCTVTVPSNQTTILSDEGSGITNRKLIFTIGFANAAITADVSSLTPAGASISVAIDAVGRVQTLTFSGNGAARTLYAASHEIAVTDSIYVKADTSYVEIASGGFSVQDSNTILVSAAQGSTIGAATSVTEVGRLAITYAPGADKVPCRRKSTFYLPGVTTGIASADDIPLPTRQSDAASLIAAIFEGDTEIYYEVGDLEQWRDSPILVLTVTTLNATQL
jgi:hypothetical protein